MSLKNRTPKSLLKIGVIHKIIGTREKIYVWTGERHFELKNKQRIKQLNDSIAPWHADANGIHKVKSGTVVTYQLNRNGDVIYCKLVEMEVDALKTMLPFYRDRDIILECVPQADFYKDHIFDFYFENVFQQAELESISALFSYWWRPLQTSKLGEDSSLSFQIYMDDLPVHFRFDPYLKGFHEKFSKNTSRSYPIDTERFGPQKIEQEFVGPRRAEYDRQCVELTLSAREVFLKTYDSKEHRRLVKALIDKESKVNRWGYLYGGHSNPFVRYLNWKPTPHDYTDHYTQVFFDADGSIRPMEVGQFIQAVEMQMIDQSAI